MQVFLLLLFTSTSLVSLAQCHKLFVVGGQSPSSQYKAEIIDLTQEERICPPISDYPGAREGSVGAFIDGRAMVCGGGPLTDECHYYDNSSNAWFPMAESLLTPRSSPTAILLSPTELWITGGDTGISLSSTSEVYTSRQGFSQYVTIPGERLDHSLIKINDSNFMLAGGFYEEDEAWMLDRDSGEWRALPDLMYPRSGLQGGLVTFHNGTTIVIVAGGILNPTSSEIFDLIEEVWLEGPDLPVGIDSGASVPYDDTFLIVGGFPEMQSIYTFDPLTEDWVELPQRMSVGKAYFAAFLVPDDFITC